MIPGKGNELPVCDPWLPLGSLGCPLLGHCFVEITFVSSGQEPQILFNPYETSLLHMKNENTGDEKKRNHIGIYKCKPVFSPKPRNDLTVLAVISVCLTSGFDNILGPILAKEFPHIRDIVGN